MRAATLLSVACYLTGLTSVATAEEPRPLDIVAVFVARTEIPAFTSFKEPEKLFKAVRYVKGDEPCDAITSLEKLKGTILGRALAEDQPVKGKDLIRENTGVDLGGLGLRASAVKVTWTMKEDDIILPNCRVDVVLTTTTEKGKSRSSVVIKNVLVLALDKVAVGDEFKPRVVVLAVTAAEAQVLSLGGKLGTFSVVLRASEDPKPEPSKKVTVPPSTNK